MALLWVDGFDQYASSAELVPERGYRIGNAGTIDTGTFRDGIASHASTSTSFLASPILGIASTGRCVWSFWWRFTVAPAGNVLIGWIGNGGLINKVTLQINAGGILELADAALAAYPGGVGTTALSINTWYFIEVRGRVNAAIAAGDCEVRIDGNPEISVTPGTNTTGGGGANVIDEFGMWGGGVGTQFTDDIVFYDDTGAQWNANTYEGLHRFQLLAPNGNGATSDLVGSDADQIDNYLQVDENPNDGDTTFNASSTPGELDTYAVADVTGSPPAIKAVQTMAIANKQGLGPRTMRQVTRSGGTNFFGPSESLAQADYNHYYQIHEVDPNTAATWLEANVNSAEFGVEVET